VKQAMSGFVPFGARRTMTQEKSSDDDEEEIKLEDETSLEEVLRLFIIECLKLH